MKSTKPRTALVESGQSIEAETGIAELDRRLEPDALKRANVLPRVGGTAVRAATLDEPGSHFRSAVPAEVQRVRGDLDVWRIFGVGGPCVLVDAIGLDELRGFEGASVGVHGCVVGAAEELAVGGELGVDGRGAVADEEVAAVEHLQGVL